MSDPVSRPTSDVEGATVAVSPWNRLSISMATLAALFAGAFVWSLLRSDLPEVDDSVAITQDPQEPSFDLSTAVAPRQLVWVNIGGIPATPVDPDWWFDRGAHPGGGGFGLSPDGTRIAVRHFSAEYGYDIWVKDLVDGAFLRITFDEFEDMSPTWADDETITFISDRVGSGRVGVGARDVWSTSADGTGEAVLVFDHVITLNEGLWAPDGETLLIREAGGSDPETGMAYEGGRDILAVRPGVDRVAEELLAEREYDESSAAISRDGRWIAYVSTETGILEVFVRPFPDVDADKVPVSSGGGIMPLWAHNGRELFFVEPGADASTPGTMMAAQFETTPDFRIGRTYPLFELEPGILTAPSFLLYDVSRDDRWFLMQRDYTGP